MGDLFLAAPYLPVAAFGALLLVLIGIWRELYLLRCGRTTLFPTIAELRRRRAEASAPRLSRSRV